MSVFDDFIDDALGDDDALTDIRAVVRRAWFYDFDGYPIRIWQGKGRLFTSDGNMWLGSIDGNGLDHHKTPAVQDGRDGSSATYNMTLNVIDYPGKTALETHDAIKKEQWRAAGRKVTSYFVAFRPDEALRPETPIKFDKEFTMMSVKFSEKIVGDPSGLLSKQYSVTVAAKDGNFGRSNVPGGTYADTVQKQRAKELGVNLDRGSEFLALLANRTYQLP